MPIGAIVFLVVLTLAVAAYFMWPSGGRKLMPEALWRVELDDVRVTVVPPEGEPRSVRWDQLTRIGIRTTDDGPWGADVFWGLHEGGSKDAAAVFPGGATGEKQFMEAMEKRLIGVDLEQFIRAMGSTSNAYFVIWESEGQRLRTD